MKMKIYQLFLTLLFAFSLGSCNKEDDIMATFANGQTWHWSGSYDTPNWKDNNKSTPTLDRAAIQEINSKQEMYIIQFSNDGTVTGRGSDFTFNGTWSANGKDQSFHINLRSNKTPSGLDATFYQEIVNAQFYRGDSQLIRLFNGTKNHYIQFYPIGFNN